ncbi:MAG: hypothetical protein HGA29_07140 [Syntrophaceae bacterium]|nr:hypothetical protein [Syntrophaceae bacterium]
MDEIKRINQEISVKFGKIEVHIAHAKSITGLFETLFADIEKEFAVPFVWLTLVEKEITAPVIEAVESSAVLKNKLGVISEDLFNRILSDGLQPVLANKDLQPFYKLLPSTNKFFVKSLAAIPLYINDEVVGSWNNGDILSDRYRPDMDTRLLQKLGQKISARLTELASGAK